MLLRVWSTIAALTVAVLTLPARAAEQFTTHHTHGQRRSARNTLVLLASSTAIPSLLSSPSSSSSQSSSSLLSPSRQSSSLSSFTQSSPTQFSSSSLPPSFTSPSSFSISSTFSPSFLSSQSALSSRISLYSSSSVPPPILVSSSSLSSSSFSMSPLPSSSFWTNGSLVGVEVECEDAAKLCLSMGRLLHEPSGRCYPLGSSAPCKDNSSALIVDEDALRRGQLRSVCRRNDPCDGYIMAYDGGCYNSSDIRSRLCNTSATIVIHPTGLYECVCLGSGCRQETTVIRQPRTPDRCTLSDFNQRKVGHFRVRCNPEEAKCLRNTTLPFHGDCYIPLTSRACPNGQWLVLDERAARAGLLHVECQSRFPCGSDAQKLHADGRCHTNEELRKRVAPGYRILHMPNGDTVFAVSNGVISIESKEESGVCVWVVLLESEIPPSAVNPQTHNLEAVDPWAMRRCGMNNEELCSRGVESFSPDPDIGRRK